MLVKELLHTVSPHQPVEYIEQYRDDDNDPVDTVWHTVFSIHIIAYDLLSSEWKYVQDQKMSYVDLRNNRLRIITRHVIF